jgi:CRP/FNR family nitrogen fixation transcriptional regulator
MALRDDPRPEAAPTAMTEVMRRLGQRTRYAKDQEIFAQEEDADLVYMVVSGAVRTTRLLSDGRRQIGGFYYAGDLIGLETGPAHRYSAEALVDSEVLVARRSALAALAGDGVLDRALLATTRRELDRAQEHILVLGRKTASEKVAGFLKDLAQRGGGERVALPMSRQDMADYLGLTIETVSRMLTHLQCAAVVEFDGRRRFTVKRWGALEQMAA